MDPQELDQLALRSRNGDPRALATLYRATAPALLGYLERILGERADAEDVLHETFLRVFEGRGRYSGRGRFREWLFTVATRLAWDRKRRFRRHGELMSAFSDDLAPRSSPDPSQALVYEELLKRVASALSDFPPAYAAAFHLRVREGFSYREIARISGEPEETLRSRVHRALKQIRRTLAPEQADRIIREEAKNERKKEDTR
jgi:RNA polymerase sigma-70 factor (ECF subfamily)